MTARPHKPASDRELGAFERRWCERCASWPADDLACPVWAYAQAYEPDAPHFPPQWVEDAQGPRCTTFTTPHIPSGPELAEHATRAAFVGLDGAVTVEGAAAVEALARAIDRIRYARHPKRRGRESLPYDEACEVPHVLVRDLTDGLRAIARDGVALSERRT